MHCSGPQLIIGLKSQKFKKQTESTVVWRVQAPVSHTSVKAVGVMVLQDLGLIMTTSYHFKKLISMLERPCVREPIDSPSWVQPSICLCQGAKICEWSHLAPSRPAYTLGEKHWVTPVATTQSKKFTQLSPDQIPDPQNHRI